MNTKNVLFIALVVAAAMFTADAAKKSKGPKVTSKVYFDVTINL